MVNYKCRFQYYKDKETELVVIPLEDGIKMLAVKGNTENIATKLSKAEVTYMDLYFPKFEMESKFDKKELVEFLKANGAKTMFTSSADFSKMIDTGVFIDDIVQNAKIEVDEENNTILISGKVNEQEDVSAYSSCKVVLNFPGKVIEHNIGKKTNRNSISIDMMDIWEESETPEFTIKSEISSSESFLDTSDSGGLVIAIIVIVCVIAVAAVAFVVIKKKSSKKDSDSDDGDLDSDESEKE
jgi:hypothetical protein